MNKTAYLISDIEEYGKLISFCIHNDVCVFRTFWDEREKGSRCYVINWKEKLCSYSSKRFYEYEGYDIIKPVFYLDNYGKYKLSNDC